jgi:uncharacterized membrane protein YeaQ/YmgE (transglycosylase-associated protein family)
MPGNFRRECAVERRSAGAGRAGTSAARVGLRPEFRRRGRKRRPASGGLSMSILGWLVLGLIAGFIASKIVNHTGSGILVDIVLGIVGAVVGGYLFTAFGGMPVTGFNIYSMVVAVVGAVVVLLIYHALFGRRAVTY